MIGTEGKPPLMPSTEDRIQQLAQEHLDVTRALDFDAAFGDCDISSMDAVAFIKVLGKEFGREIPPQEFAKLKTLRGLVNFLESNSG